MNVDPWRRRPRRYLAGVDWIVAALDRASRRATGGDNASQVVLVLDGRLDDARFTREVAAFTSAFPVLSGRVARAWNLAPFWRIPRRGRPVAVQVHDAGGNDADTLLARLANTPPAGRRQALAFHLVRAGRTRSYVVMRFDHRLFDAQGAEMFLDLLRRRLDGEDLREPIGNIALRAPAHLTDWHRKFDAGRVFIRTLRALRAVAAIRFPRPAAAKGRAFRFRRMVFDEAATQVAQACATRDAGFLMFMPYALAAATGALHEAVRARRIAGREYVVAVSVGQRSPDTAETEVFFNHLSFLLFSIPVDAVGDRGRLLATIRVAMYEQVKAGLAEAVAESSMLMRILPLSLFSRAIFFPLRGEFSSFAFSCLQDGRFTADRFMGVRVRNLYHMPLMPVPPGLGLVVHRFRDRMAAVLCYLEGILTEGEAEAVEQAFRRRMTPNGTGTPGEQEVP